MHYYILAISKNKAQLFEVLGDRVHPHPVDAMPTSMSGAWGGMERNEKSLQFHSTGNGTVGFHGQGGAKDVEEQEEDRYVHAVAKSLHDVLHGQNDPLVFAGVTELYGMFKKFDQSGRLLEEHIHGSPDQWTMEELKAKADPLVRAHMLERNTVVLEQFATLHGTGRTSIDVSEIQERASAGKVETLILPEGMTERYKDLAREIWKHRGSIILVEAGSMPEEAAMAAILRL